MAEKRRAARSAAEMAEVWRVKAAKAAQRAAKQEEKDARAKVAAESPTHKAAVDLLRYLEMILHLAAAESLHKLEKDNPGIAKEAAENYREFKAAFEKIIGGSDRDGKHWALDRELLRSMVDGIVAFLSKEAQDGREETGGEKRR